MGFKPSTWAQPVQDIVKEYNAYDKEQTTVNEVPDKPESLSTSMVRRGGRDPLTGALTGNSKQRCVLAGNVSGFTEAGKRNYERIFGHS